MNPCPCCGQMMNSEQMKKAEAYESEEEEGPEVEVSIEGDPDSVKNILKRMIK